MFFQMAARRDPLAAVRDFLQRLGDSNTPLSEAQRRRAARTFLDAPALLGESQAPIGGTNLRDRRNTILRGDEAADRVDTRDADRPPTQYPAVDGVGGGGLNGHGYIPQPSDGAWLTGAVFAEGANTPDDMEALTYAIINRVRPQFRGSGRPEIGRSLREVLHRPGQFAFMPNQGGNGPAGSRNWASAQDPERMNSPDREAYKSAQTIVTQVLDGRRRDVTDGATFYFSSPHYDPRAAEPDGAPPFFRGALGRGDLEPSRYVSRYGRPLRRGDPSPNYFFVHPADRR